MLTFQSEIKTCKITLNVLLYTNKFENYFSFYLSLRKEVIQPHLPVRLPCYDFTPLTKHTFDSDPPCGLVYRLRVSSTRMV